MIFVLESYRKNRKAKIVAWDDAASAWLGERAGRGYGYYSKEDYENRVPYPVFRLPKLAPFTPFIIVGVVFMATLVFCSKIPPKKIDPNNPHGCSRLVQKGDNVAVNDGNFSGSKGIVIEQRDDCAINLTLTHSTWGVARCKAIDNYHCDRAKEDGEILKVDDSSTIVKL